MTEEPTEVFVFGSNLAGRHGRGAAQYARQHHGAVYGQGVGRQGNSYAIPTKDRELRTLPLLRIRQYVVEFLVYARAHPDTRFKLTAIGCGLAGYHPSQIAPMFAGAPPNVRLPIEFTMMQVKAPWSPKQVDALNRFQELGHVHPFTCGGANHKTGDDTTLRATPDGWICLRCDYTQNWAHEAMFHPEKFPPPFADGVPH